MSGDATIAVETPDSVVRAGMYAKVTTTPAPFSASHNGSVAFWGAGSDSRGGRGVSRYALRPHTLVA
jgi:hypothetical protein